MVCDGDFPHSHDLYRVIASLESKVQIWTLENLQKESSRADIKPHETEKEQISKNFAAF